MQKKTLFDHIKQITSKSDTNYYDNLSEEDTKSYNVYMIHRFLSMNVQWIELVNEVQKYSQQLKQRGTHKVYDDLIPKSNIFLKYVKASNERKYNQATLNILTQYFECSEREAKAYYDIFIKTTESKTELLEIIKKFGGEEREFQKIEKEILKA